MADELQARVSVCTFVSYEFASNPDKTLMPEHATHAVETQLNGFFRSDFVSNEKVVIDLYKPELTEGQIPPKPITVHDGRLLQQEEDDGKPDFVSRFFRKHGFVLIPHKSAVRNWDSGAFGVSDRLGTTMVDQSSLKYSGVNEIATKYHEEVDDLLRNCILPGQNLQIEQPDQLLRRGKDTAHPFYGVVVHNDYGVRVEDYHENAIAFDDEASGQAWRDSYEANNIQGFMVINFWRTVHMSKPLQHMPLAVLDAASVDRQDLVSSGLKGFTLSGRITNQLNVRFNETQKWYYYPDMTVDEVLVLNLFCAFKNESDAPFRQCFHSAFEHPLTPSDAEERQSCEHRVSVYVLHS